MLDKSRNPRPQRHHLEMRAMGDVCCSRPAQPRDPIAHLVLRKRVLGPSVDSREDTQEERAVLSRTRAVPPLGGTALPVRTVLGLLSWDAWGERSWRGCFVKTNIPATLFPLTVSVPPTESVNAVFPGVQHTNPHADSLPHWISAQEESLETEKTPRFKGMKIRCNAQRDCNQIKRVLALF